MRTKTMIKQFNQKEADQLLARLQKAIKAKADDLIFVLMKEYNSTYSVTDKELDQLFQENSKRGYFFRQWAIELEKYANW